MPAYTESSTAPVVAACAICGGLAFGPGPQGRMAPNGRAPRCLRCGSLERQRSAHHLLQALPCAAFVHARALQIGREIMRPQLFAHLDTLSDEGEPLLRRLALQGDAQYDFIILSTQLEQIPDDRAALAHLRRMLAPQGMLIVCFGDARTRDVTVNHATAQAPWGTWHAYGRDLARHFSFTPGLALGVADTDDSSGRPIVLHVLFNDPAQARRFSARLGAWRPSAAITAEDPPCHS